MTDENVKLKIEGALSDSVTQSLRPRSFGESHLVSGEIAALLAATECRFRMVFSESFRILGLGLS